ncbi:C-GCAxxG-C-C family protein [Gallibacter sp. Marseille-QA0791]|uniref:C-GCAxxG-C-C family protein n=1 Tax=Gallibacter sp. Marseille-QA0791 TaxID=3378781 RepID=UPI003D0E6A82
MGELAEKAVANHKKKYNCSQAVACAFCDKLGRDEKEVFELMEAFGLGMGTMGTCGAVSAMAAVVGMVESDGALDAPKTKKESYKAMKALTEKFKEKNGTVVCKELKGVETKKVIRSCDGCVQDAAELLEEYLEQKK